MCSQSVIQLLSKLVMLASCKCDEALLPSCTIQMEQDIAAFAKIIGEKATSEKFLEASKARHIAIDSILWNSEMEQWLDYWLPTDGDSQQVLLTIAVDLYWSYPVFIWDITLSGGVY